MNILIQIDFASHSIILIIFAVKIILPAGKVAPVNLPVTSKSVAPPSAIFGHQVAAATECSLTGLIAGQSALSSGLPTVDAATLKTFPTPQAIGSNLFPAATPTSLFGVTGSNLAATSTAMFGAKPLSSGTSAVSSSLFGAKPLDMSSATTPNSVFGAKSTATGVITATSKPATFSYGSQSATTGNKSPSIIPIYLFPSFYPSPSITFNKILSISIK